MQDIYFLSIREQYVSMILDRSKKWEFRANPNFGRSDDHELSAGDFVFVVSTSPDREPIFNCVCRIGRVLRGREFHEYFQDRESNHWKESGCSDGTDRDWDFFRENILGSYETAVELDAVYQIDPPVRVSEIVHNIKNKPWNGKGLTPALDLKRYRIEGNPIVEHFEMLARSIVGA